MAVDYDLIVVGPTPTAQSAAIAAARTYARVAWITDTDPITSDPFVLLREGTRSLSNLKGQGTLQPQDWTEGLAVLATALDRDPVARVQAYGGNYVQGPIQFQRERGLSVTVGGRSLRSRSYLLAMSPGPGLPAIPGINHPNVWTIHQLLHRLKESVEKWPQHISLLGHGPQAVEVCQSLQRLGIKVLLLTDGHPLLPQEDPEVATLLQAYLEGSGIEAGGISINTQQRLTDISPLRDGCLLLKLAEMNVETEALVIATEDFRVLPSYLAPLNLKKVQQGIWVDSALQTSVSTIFACGPILGGYQVPEIASYEAKVAVQNALFESRSPIRYHQIPYAILSDPPLARVGLTESQARRYDPTVQVIRQTYRDCDRALFAEDPAGLCKVMVRTDGMFLGAHIVGTCAQEAIYVFALALQQGCKLQDLERLGDGSFAYMQVVQQMAVQWQQQSWCQHRDHHERCFYKRRKQIGR